MHNEIELCKYKYPTHFEEKKKAGGGRRFSVIEIFRQIHEKAIFGIILITWFSHSELQVYHYKLLPSVKPVMGFSKCYRDLCKRKIQAVDFP